MSGSRQLWHVWWICTTTPWTASSALWRSRAVSPSYLLFFGFFFFFSWVLEYLLLSWNPLLSFCVLPSVANFFPVLLCLDHLPLRHIALSVLCFISHQVKNYFTPQPPLDTGCLLYRPASPPPPPPCYVSSTVTNSFTVLCVSRLPSAIDTSS